MSETVIEEEDEELDSDELDSQELDPPEEHISKRDRGDRKATDDRNKGHGLLLYKIVVEDIGVYKEFRTELGR